MDGEPGSNLTSVSVVIDRAFEPSSSGLEILHLQGEGFPTLSRDLPSSRTYLNSKGPTRLVFKVVLGVERRGQA